MIRSNLTNNDIGNGTSMHKYGQSDQSFDRKRRIIEFKVTDYTDEEREQDEDLLNARCWEGMSDWQEI